MPKETGFQVIENEEICVKGAGEIILAGDIGCTTFSKESRKIIEKILKNRCDFFIILGDIASSGVREEFDEVISFCDERVKEPIFALCGNHDLPDYKKILGKSTYALIFNNTVFIVLDNVADSKEVREEDLHFLEEELEKHSNEKRFVILFHIPPPTDISTKHMTEEKWNGIKEVLDNYRDRIDCIICGHIHGFQEYDHDGYHIFITGGGGAKLHNLEKDPIKKYHALKLKINDKGLAEIKVIQIGAWYSINKKRGKPHDRQI
ncbi:metallophosphoesterase family protein [Candidatus Omnitrophota bacterium]